MQLFELRAHLDNIGLVAELARLHLQQAPFFQLSLHGDLGAGKTTFVQALLRSFGLDAAQPVLSPTFAYMHDYQIAGKNYAHLDLYRCPPGVSLEDFVAYDYEDYVGILIEWSDRLVEEQRQQNTHHLFIARDPQHELTRVFTLQKNKSV